MIALLRQRNFGLLWWGGLISFIGDWVLFVSLPLYILDLTGSVVAMGLLFVINIIPMLAFSSLGGVFVDRWDRKRILVVTNLLLVPLYLLLLFFDTASMVWVVYVVGFLGNTVRQLLNPAENALLPRLVGEENLATANALNSLNNNLARLIGPAVGGVIFATFGFRLSVVIDVFTFLAAAILISLISAPASLTRAEHHPSTEHTEHTSALKKFQAEWLEGLKIIKGNRVLISMIALLGINNVVDGFVTVLFAVYVERALGGGAPELGALLTSQALGGLIGGIFIGRITRRFASWQLVGAGFVLLGVLDFLTFGIPVLPLNMFFLVIVGIPIVGLDVGAMTLFQTITEDRYRGRIFGIYGTTAGVLMLLGRGLATIVGGQVDIVMLLAGMSLLYIPTGLLAFRLLRTPANAPAQSLAEEPVRMSA
ncbi:MAG: MFS transporter [Chloroflexota bacterium]